MMRRRRGGPGTSGCEWIGAAAKSLLALTFALTVAVSPVSLISCPHHGGSHAGHAGHAFGSGAEASGEHEATGGRHGPIAHQTPDDSDEDEHGHGNVPFCCCLGECSPGSSTAHPASAANDVRMRATVLLPTLDGRDGVHRAADPWFLPYPNGPPTTS